MRLKREPKNTVEIFGYVDVTYHLLVLSTMTPLSMENESVGRPAMFHALILIA